MMAAPNTTPPARLDPVAVILHHLRDGDEVLRCASARALRRLADPAAAPALVEALIDEDPDVRVDAMEALLACAGPEDADAIRRSLLGDPVKEVKNAAIEVLCRLDDRASLPLLRALAKDRCEHDVAWEDEAGMWDDWLDVQVAAIEALGRMGAAEAIEDLLQARTDELGQELDDVVFAALACIPDGGIEALLGLLRDRNERVRARALRALAAARRDLLTPLRELLLRDASPDVRRLAIVCLESTDPAVDELVRADPDPDLRRRALEVFAAHRPELAMAALGDPDEAVRAKAVEAVVARAPTLEQRDRDDLAANLQAWLLSAGPGLATTCARLLPSLTGDRAGPLLCQIATDRDRSQELRVASLQSLAACPTSDSLDALRAAAIDPVRQIRLAAVAALADLSKRPDQSIEAESCVGDAARAVLVAALRGELLEASTVPNRAPHDPDQGIGASKAEEERGARIVISPEGDIVPAEALGAPEPVVPQPDLGMIQGAEPEEAPSDSNVIQGRFPRSTLDAIQADGSVSPVVSDDGSKGEADPAADDPRGGAGRGKRRRVAVDGPDDVAGDIPLIALRVAADCPGATVEAALRDNYLAEDQRRPVAADAIARRAEVMPLSPDLLVQLVASLDDPDPVVRGHTTQAIVRAAADAGTHLQSLLDDPDAIIRALALTAVATSEAIRSGFADRSSLVRKAALDAVTASGDQGDLEAGLSAALAGGWIDSLAEACARSDLARHRLVSLLASDAAPRRDVQIALEALALAPGSGQSLG